MVAPAATRSPSKAAGIQWTSQGCRAGSPKARRLTSLIQEPLLDSTRDSSKTLEWLAGGAIQLLEQLVGLIELAHLFGRAT